MATRLARHDGTLSDLGSLYPLVPDPRDRISMPDDSPTNATSSLTLQSYLQILRRQRGVIIATVILLTVLASLPAVLADPTYAATSEVRVSALAAEGVFSSDPETTPSNQSTVDLLTELQIVQSRPLRARVVEEYGRGSDFEGPTVAPKQFSEIVQITITADEATFASDIANLYADVYVEDRRARSVETLETKADELRARSADARDELEEIAARLGAEDLPPNEVSSLQLRQTTLSQQVLEFDRRADELSVNASLRGAATVVNQYAGVDLTPIRPNVVTAGLIGLALGALLGLALSVLFDTVQDKIGSQEDLANVRRGLPLLAAVPHADMTGPAGSPGTTSAKEAYRYLRTGIRVFGLNSQLRSLLVTSAVGEEGKTTTAIGLAITMADAGDRVVLLDVDLRRPTLHDHFDLPNDRGLSTLLVGDGTIEDTIHFVRDNLAVVTSGPPVHDPPQALGTEQFNRVLKALVDQADFTILDSTPVLPVADALIAGQHVDGTVVVGRIGNVRRRAVRDVLSRIDSAGIPLIGLIANDTPEAVAYGYYDTDRRPSRAAPVGT